MRAFTSSVCSGYVAIAIAAATLLSTASCTKFLHKDEGADAAADAAPTAVVVDAATAPTAPTLEAKNLDQVTRFPNEVKLAGELAKLERATSSVREDPPSGKVFAVLAKGTDVVKIATHDPFVLIAFTSPHDANERLAGWVNKDAFVASVTPAKPVAALKCAAGQTMLWGDPPFCDKLCTTAADCGEKQFCSGVAPLFGAGAVPGKAVKFCVGENTAAKDAGSPATTATDAAVAPAPAPVTADSGAAAATTADAAAPGAALANLYELAVGDACKGGRVKIDKYCRIPCAADADCPGLPRSKCALKNNIKVCTSAK